MTEVWVSVCGYHTAGRGPNQKVSLSSCFLHPSPFSSPVSSISSSPLFPFSPSSSSFCLFPPVFCLPSSLLSLSSLSPFSPHLFSDMPSIKGNSGECKWERPAALGVGMSLRNPGETTDPGSQMAPTSKLPFLAAFFLCKYP